MPTTATLSSAAPAASRLLGEGLYTLAEAALYARVPPQTLTRWLWGTSNRQAAFQPKFDQDERFVSFYDFVTALAIREIRQQKKVPLQTIREAIDYAEQQHGISYPLAHKHVVGFMPKERLVINIGSAHDPAYLDAAGKSKGNRLFRPIAEVFLEQCSWDADGLAQTYTPWKYEQYNVVQNPQVRLGEPLVTSCGLTAQTLWEAFRSEGGAENAARAYGVEPAEVMAGCTYMTSLLPAA